MTAVTYQPAARRLVLDRALLNVLGNLATNGLAGTHEQIRELADAGLVEPGGQVSAAAVPTARAVGRPVLRCVVTVTDGQGRRAATIWVDRERAVLHPEAGPDAANVVSVTAGLLPFLLARATGFAPLPAPEGATTTVGEFVATEAALLAAIRGSAPPPWPADQGDAVRQWTVRCEPVGPHPPPPVVVLNVGGSAVWAAAGRVGDAVRWVRTDTRQMWRSFAAIQHTVESASRGSS